MKKPVAKTPSGASRSAKSPKAASKAAAPRTARSARADAATPTRPPPRASKNILTAGIKALSHAHGEAVARQSRVFESLLGLGPRALPTASDDQASAAATTLDPFGFSKFEDVFDQRVARALLRLQVPTAQALSELTTEVERLRETVARLEAQARKR